MRLPVLKIMLKQIMGLCLSRQIAPSSDPSPLSNTAPLRLVYPFPNPNYNQTAVLVGKSSQYYTQNTNRTVANPYSSSVLS